MNVFIFSQDQEIAKFLKEVLQNVGYNCDIEDFLENVFTRIVQKKYDILFFEFDYSDEKRSHIKKIRSIVPQMATVAFAPFPILNSSNKSPETGADYFLSYPFHEENILQILQHFRHEYVAYTGEPLILGDLVLHTGEYEAVRQGKKIRLRKKEYQLLEFLMRNKNRVINRHTILEYIWNYDSQAITNTLDVHIASLRKKIDGDYPNKMLKTIYGAGYKLSDE